MARVTSISSDDRLFDPCDERSAEEAIDELAVVVGGLIDDLTALSEVHFGTLGMGA